MHYTQKQAVLLEAHRAERVKKKADRIKTILLLHEGLSYEQISQVLFLDDSTIKRYETNYRTGGWDDPPEGGHSGEDYGCRCWAEAYGSPRVEKTLISPYR